MQNLLALPAGTALVEDYRILRVLGAGGFGLTYLAREETLDRSVTIKEYFPSDFAAREATLSVRPRSGDAEADYGWGLERFIEEAQTLARFDHPNINRVYRYFRANNTAYIVLKFEEGQSFKAWLAGLGRAPRQAELDGIVGPLLDALETIHAGNYLHRDIAPDNIIIRKGGAPVLIDFGSARGEMVQLSKTVSALVKPGYSPYEQYGISGRQQGPWTDIYSLGASLYQAISGKRPTDAPTRMVADDYKPAGQVALSSYRPQFLAAIDHALKLRVEERPQSIAAWRQALLPPAVSAGHAGPAARQVEAIRPAGAAAGKPSNAPSPTAAGRPAGGTLAASPARTGLKKRLVRVLEGVAGSRADALRPDAVRADAVAPDAVQSAGSGLGQAQSPVRDEPRPDPAPVAAPAAITPVPQLVAPPPARAKIQLKKQPGWRLFSKATPSPVAPIPRPAPPKPAAGLPARVPARAVAPPKVRPEARNGSRSVALKLLAGAMLSALLLSYQDQIRTAWSHYGWSGAGEASRLLAAPAPRAGSSRKSEARAPATVITTASTVPAAEPAPPPRVIEDVVLRAHRGPVQAIAFTGDGKSLVSTGQDGTLRLWDVDKRELIRTVEAGENPTALAVLDRTAAIGHQDGRIVLWDLDRGQSVHSFKRNDAAIWSVAFAGGAQRVLAAGHDWAVALWDRQRDAGPLHLLEGHDNAVQAVAFGTRAGQTSGQTSGQGAFIATGGADKHVKLWSASDFELIRTFRGHRDFVGALAFSPDGAQLASGGFDKVVKIWATGDGGSSRTLRGHKGRVTTVAFSADGQVLASGSEDSTVRLWDWKRGRVVRTLAGHTGAVRSLAFSPDGKSIATAGEDGTIRIWDAVSVPRITASRS